MYEDLNGKVAVVTGAGGVLCGAISKALAGLGVRVAVLDISAEAADRTAGEINESGGKAVGIACDALDKAGVRDAVERVLFRWSTIDILINGAGGSRKETTTTPDLEFFDMLPEDIDGVVQLNYMSAVVPSQVVGRVFAAKKAGVILNITSIAGILPLTRTIAYSNGKAAANSFTQWLAVHMAQTYSPAIRVNAIAPGFVLTRQNRFLMIDETTGEMTARAKAVITNVPMARFGNPEEIVGAAIWLISDGASFVTGAVIPVDGGYSAFSGV
jgi:NAD(P)-dependent dehydrogenase (short-subunit alcohol dehydrogenase family)